MDSNYFISMPGEKPNDERRRYAAWRVDHPRNSKTSTWGHWGRTKTSRGWYWVIILFKFEGKLVGEPPSPELPCYRNGAKPNPDDYSVMPEYVDGFEDSEEAANQAAIDVVHGISDTGHYIHKAMHASDRYSEKYARKSKHKDWAQSVTGTSWEGRSCLWTRSPAKYPWEQYTSSPVPIVNITDKYVYILNSDARRKARWRGVPLNVSRFTRKDYVRLDRDELETDGWDYARREYEGFYTELDPDYKWNWDAEYNLYVASSGDVQQARININKDDLKEARKIMQREHPDKGGDVDKFLQAKADYQNLKSRLSEVSL